MRKRVFVNLKERKAIVSEIVELFNNPNKVFVLEQDRGGCSLIQLTERGYRYVNMLSYPRRIVEDRIISAREARKLIEEAIMEWAR